MHNLIKFDTSLYERMIWRIIQTPFFQRLRRIRQLGFSQYVYPGAAHTRFSHSLGVFHVARRIMEVIEDRLGSDFNRNPAEAALAAALPHDIGHGPFSHPFEVIGTSLDLKYVRHEEVSDQIVRDTEIAGILDDYRPGMSNQVAKIISSSAPENIYASVVSSQFDADRLDYMRRDRLMTGTRLGGIDFTWLVENLEVDTMEVARDGDIFTDVETLVPAPSAIHAAEEYILGLFQLYPTVYFHKATRAAERVFLHLFMRVFELCRNGKADIVGLPGSNPLVTFAKKPDSLKNALRLNDFVIWGSLHELCLSRNRSISQPATMLLERKPPKVIDLRAEIAQELVDSSSPETFQDTIVRTRASLADWCNARNPTIELLWVDSTIRDAYKDPGEDTGPLGKILIRQNNTPMDIENISSIVDSIPRFMPDRVYVPFDDEDSKTQVFQTIRQESKKGGKQ